MGHAIAAFIGHYAALHTAIRSLPHVHLIALAQDYGLLPVSEAFYDALAAQAPSPQPDKYPVFVYLSASLITLGEELSHHTPVAYVETDYFGGVGTQAAILWQDGDVYGPFSTETRYERNELIVTAAEQRAINRVLQRLGVRRETAKDEFEALGLRRYRSTEDWLEAAMREEH